MLTVSDVQALIVITLGDAFVLNRRVRQQRGLGCAKFQESVATVLVANAQHRHRCPNVEAVGVSPLVA